MAGFGPTIHRRKHPMDSTIDHDGNWFDAMLNAGFPLTGLNPAVDTATMLAAIASATQDLVSKANVTVATTAALPANTRTGDILTADVPGYFPDLDGIPRGDIKTVLVKDEGGIPSHINNGIYTLTVVGDGSTPWELTRRADMDDGDHAAGAFVHCEEGLVNGDSTFRCINNYGTSRVNIDALEWKFWGETLDHKYLKNLLWSDAAHQIDTDIDMDSNNFQNIYDIDEAAMLFGNATGGIENHYLYDHYLLRTIPGAGNDYIELGSFTNTKNAFLVTVTNQSDDHADAWYFSCYENQTGGAWHIVRPISGISQYVRLLVKVDGSTIDMRLMRADISMVAPTQSIVHIMNFAGQSFTPSLATGTQSPVPTITLNTAMIWQHASVVDMLGKINMNGHSIYHNDGDVYLSAGSYYDVDAATWTATELECSILYLSRTGGIQYFKDTLGSTGPYTPTKVFEINTSGVITTGSMSHAALSNLAWSAAGHSIDSELLLNGQDINFGMISHGIQIQATPPVSPSIGDIYNVATTPTGAWTGHATHLARWNGTAWTFVVPQDGWLYINGKGWAATPQIFQFFSGAWRFVETYMQHEEMTNLNWGNAGHTIDVDFNLDNHRLLYSTQAKAWAMGTAENLQATPPVTPVNDGFYLIYAGATGIWTGRDGQVARYKTVGGWTYRTPEPLEVWTTKGTANLYIANPGVTWGLLWTLVNHNNLQGVTSDQHHAKSHAHDGVDGSGTVAHSALTGIGSSDHHARYADSEARAAVKWQTDVSLAGITPVDADVTAWADGDRGHGIGTGGREFYMIKRGTAVKYTELS